MLNNGVDSKEFLLSEIIRKGAALIIQELLEQEVTDFLGREHYERKKEGDREGYRNGYEPLNQSMLKVNFFSYEILVLSVFL